MNRSSRREEMTTRMESKYPTLDEVDVIPMPSLGEAFRYAEQQQQQQQHQRHSRREPDQHLNPPRSRQQSPNSCTTSSSSSRRSVTSFTSGGGGSSKDKQRERLPPSVETYSVSSQQSHKRPPALQRLKSSDLLDTKPAAVMRPAATPGAVEVNHAPYFMQPDDNHQHPYGGGGGSVASQRSRQHHSSAAAQAAAAAAAPAFPRMELEVSPGIFLPLHGSEETYSALRSDRLCATYCLACETPLFCVEYAAQVLCPACRVVSPVFTHEAPRRSSDDYYAHNSPAGVGLGMTVDEYDRTWAEAEERLVAAAAYHGTRGYYDDDEY
jgi:hypothetical protein